MEDHIFFKDKNNVLKGPFTERQVQEWYRQKWFDSSFPFYFTHGNKRPSDEESSGVTLEELRSYNGIGCPFRRIDESKKNEDTRRREEGGKRLEKIEKEIADLKQKCAAIPGIEKSLEQVNKKLEGLAASLNKGVPKPVEKASKVEPVQKMKWNHEEYGNLFAACVMGMLEVYGTGIVGKSMEEIPDDFVVALDLATSEENAARKAACERILVEKMKEKEFFCCLFCDAVQFNYKQALIHFTCKEHLERELAVVQQCSRAERRDIATIFSDFTNLHVKFAEEDAKIEQERRKKYGPVDSLGAMRQNLLPSAHFMMNLVMKYMQSLCGTGVAANLTDATAVVMRNLKGEIGRKLMAELHEHIGQAKTWCCFCGIKTGDREGFYAHLTSSAHLITLNKGGQYYQQPMRNEIMTMAVNVHRKDLI